MSDVVVILYPSLHIKDGAVARLTRSSSDSRQAELLHKNPVECALAYRAQGFSWLHIVDLDGAFAESPVNAECIEAMIKTVDLPMQLSGGIHNLNTVEKWLSKGVQRIVLASAALENPEFVREAAKQFPGHIAVKIYSIGGYVARTGWARISSLKALDFALRVEEAGAERKSA